jgi:hypothetical protein
MRFDSIKSLEDAGFQGYLSVNHLISSKCVEIPKMKGIYLVVNESMKKDFLSKSVGGHSKDKDPTVTKNELEKEWVNETIVLYIGKAGGTGNKATLNSRIKQYISFGRGNKSPHHGGRYIWQLANNRELLLSWKTLADIEPRQYEEQLIAEFKAIHGKKPFANLQK